VDERELARYYTLSEEDLAAIGKRQRPETRIGFAFQLCYLRFPGRPLNSGGQPPANMLEYVASQLGENPAAFDRYARSRDATRREHFSEIMRTFGFRAFDERVYRELYRWLGAPGHEHRARNRPGGGRPRGDAPARHSGPGDHYHKGALLGSEAGRAD